MNKKESKNATPTTRAASSPTTPSCGAPAKPAFGGALLRGLGGVSHPSDLQLLQRALFASACVNASLIYRSFHLRRPYATLWHYTNDDQRMTLFNFIVKSLLE